MKTTIFALSFASLILLITQPSNCFDSYSMYGSVEEHIFDALPPLFESTSDATEYPFSQKLIPSIDYAPLPRRYALLLPRENNTQHYFYHATPLFSTAASSRLSSSSRKRVREKGTHQCNYPGCTKTYTEKRNLNRHVTIDHEGIKPFACTTTGCTEAFVRIDQLISHLTFAHGNEKPYKCSGCPKAFIRKNALIKHIRTFHNKERRYQCNYPGCTNTYIDNTGLKKHKLSSHQAFACTATGCTQSFHSKAILASHIANLHRKASKQSLTTSRDLSTELNNHADEQRDQ